MQKTDVFCKYNEEDKLKKSKLWKQVCTETSFETHRALKIYQDYKKTINSEDIIKEEDEIRDELMTEVEELKKIVDQSRIKYKKLKTMQRIDPYSKSIIEKMLMKLSDIETENKTTIRSPKKILNFKEKFEIVKTKNKKLREKYKNLKSELIELNKFLDINVIGIKDLNQDFSELQIVNEALRSELEKVVKSNKNKTSKKSYSVNRKNKSSLNLQLSKFTSKQSFAISPSYNASFQSLSQAEKRKQSSEVPKTVASKPYGPIRLIRLQN
jgi:hypothetical protein